MKSLLQFVLCLGALLLGIEFVLRTWLVPPLFKEWDAELGKVNRVGARVVFSREGWGSRVVNSYALMGPEPPPLSESRRVLLFGNSFVEALNVSRSTSFTGGIESRLPGVHVVNAAHSGWSIAQELVLLKRLAPLLTPDVVVLQIPKIKPFDRSELHFSFDGEGWKIIPAPPDSGLRGTIKRYTDPISKHSALLTMLLEKFNTLRVSQATRLREKFGGGHSAPVESASENPQRSPMHDPDLEESALEYVIREIKALDLPLILLVIPTPDFGVGTCQPRYPEQLDLFARTASALDVPLVDVTAALCEYYFETGQPPFGFHNNLMGTGHLNASGHRIVADALAVEIERLLR